MDIIRILLLTHIIIGACVLLTGLVQILMPKAGRPHRVVGRIYFAGMTVVFLTALPLCLFDPRMGFFSRVFLGVIAIFSYYFTVTGFRLGTMKSQHTVPRADKMITYAGLAGWLVMAGFSIWSMTHGRVIPGAILAVFALIFGMAVWGDFLRLIVRNSTRGYFQGSSWMLNHTSRMLGSYIAAFTAFCVNVSPLKPEWLNWLLPSVLGSFLISFFVRRVKRMIGRPQV